MTILRLASAICLGAIAVSLLEIPSGCGAGSGTARPAPDHATSRESRQAAWPHPGPTPTQKRTGSLDVAQIFARTSIWNRRLEDDAPLVSDTNPRLARMMRRSLLFQGRQDLTRPPGAAGGTFTQVMDRGSPTWVATAHDRRVRIVLDNPGSHAAWLRAVLARGVPIPDGAFATTSNSDATLKVWQPDWRGPLTAETGATGKLWELWRASTPRQNAPGAGSLPWKGLDGRPAPSHGDRRWHAVYGGVVSYTSKSPGYSVDRGGRDPRGGAAPPASPITARAARELPDTERRLTTTSASGLPLAPRAITFADWDRGYIDHVMGWGLRDHPCRDDPSLGIRRFVWPAQFASDCREAPPGWPRAAIPYGQRFRISRDAEMPDGLPKFARMVWTAARDYGVMFVEGVPAGIAVDIESQPIGDPTNVSENWWFRRGAFGPKPPLEPWKMGGHIASFLHQLVPLAPPPRSDPSRSIVAPGSFRRTGSG
jgi:hypothetical protein